MAETLLEVRELVKRFGGVVATDHASFSVESGEIHALIGPNGAGKTTLIHQISGAMRPDLGSIYFRGDDITKISMHDRVHLGLARSYQITNLYTAFTALENVALAVQARSGTSFSFFRRILSENDMFGQARAVLDKVGLSSRESELVRNLSHGEQRQLEVAMVLATRPRLLLLDEPMAGMGHNELQKMVDLLSGLKREVTILLVEHDMDAVFRLADRISVLVYGRVIVTGTPDEIRRHPEVRKAYLGEDVPA